VQKYGLSTCLDRSLVKLWSKYVLRPKWSDLTSSQVKKLSRPVDQYEEERISSAVHGSIMLYKQPTRAQQSSQTIRLSNNPSINWPIEQMIHQSINENGLVAELQQRWMTTDHLGLSSPCIFHLFNLLHSLIQLLLQRRHPATHNDILHSYTPNTTVHSSTHLHWSIFNGKA